MLEEYFSIHYKSCYILVFLNGKSFITLVYISFIRVAVPDINFKNEWYQNMVKVGGNGDPNHPSYTHKIVYDYKTLSNVFEKAGFSVELLEYCDEKGFFHYKYWNEADGRIGRSLRYDTRNSNEKLGMVSIIIDAKKPLHIKYI